MYFNTGGIHSCNPVLLAGKGRGKRTESRRFVEGKAGIMSKDEGSGRDRAAIIGNAGSWEICNVKDTSDVVKDTLDR